MPLMTLTQQLELIQTATSVEAIAPELPALVEEARLECIGDRPPPRLSHSDPTVEPSSRGDRQPGE